MGEGHSLPVLYIDLFFSSKEDKYILLKKKNVRVSSGKSGLGLGVEDPLLLCLRILNFMFRTCSILRIGCWGRT